MNLILNNHKPKKLEGIRINPSQILFVAECSPWGELGLEILSKAFQSVQAVFWSPGMPKPDLSQWRGDWIISFKADLILSRATLESAEKGAINFHPCPPKYRGIGGYWWALKNRDDSFGVTCHYMNEQIDRGDIIMTSNFPIGQNETVDSLKDKAAIHSLKLLNEIINAIVGKKDLVPCGIEWSPHLYTYKELEAAQSSIAAIDADSTNSVSSITKNNVLHTLETAQKEIAAQSYDTSESLITTETAPRLALG